MPENGFEINNVSPFQNCGIDAAVWRIFKIWGVQQVDDVMMESNAVEREDGGTFDSILSLPLCFDFLVPEKFLPLTDFYFNFGAQMYELRKLNK